MSGGLLGRGWRAAMNALLDPSIVLSFDATGYRRHAADFDLLDLEVGLAGRRALVTGANSGLGFALARGLAARGAELTLLCRDRARGEDARARLRAEHPAARVELELLDISDLSQVDRYLREAAPERVEILVHNAGALPAERVSSADGYELTLATHLLGPLRLTAGLGGALSRGVGARVIWVSSGGMYGVPLDPEALFDPPDPYDGVRAYAQTKRAQVEVSAQLARAFRPAEVASHAMHPGWADTPGVRSSIPGFFKLTRRILRSAEQGADTALWLAVCDRAQATPGRFWFDRAARSEHLAPWTRRPASLFEEAWARLCAAAEVPLEARAWLG